MHGLELELQVTDVLKFGTYFTENTFHLHYTLRLMLSDPGGRAVNGVGLVLLACWDCGFDSPPGAWMSVSCECCVLSGRYLCVGSITRPEESHRVRCV